MFFKVSRIIQDLREIKAHISRLRWLKLLVYNEVVDKSTNHHSSLTKLRRSAEEGCHLCSLIKLYCSGNTNINLNSPVVLIFNLRFPGYRKDAFSVIAGGGYTKV